MATPTEGNLTKRGSEFPHSWKQRYFILEADSRLSYWETLAASKVTDRPSKPKGEGTLVAVRERRTSDASIGLTFVFFGGQEMQIRAQSEFEQQRWLASLDHAQSPRPGSAAPLLRASSQKSRASHEERQFA